MAAHDVKWDKEHSTTYQQGRNQDQNVCEVYIAEMFHNHSTT